MNHSSSSLPAVITPEGGREIVTDCWNRTGVCGDGTCPELSSFIHCRNCPVYSQAGARWLDRSLPDNYRKEWAEHFAEKKDRAQACNCSALVFRIDSEWLGIPTAALQEVAERRPIHSLPGRRTGCILGLANVRGELLICLSLGHALGFHSPASLESVRATYARILVLDWRGNRFGFPVDQVLETHRFHLDDLKPPPSTLARSGTAFTEGMFSWHGRIVGLLNADRLTATLTRSLI